MRDRFGFPARVAILPWAGALSFLASIVLPSGTQTAIANGDTRTIRLYHAHTKETIEATYRVDGRYDPAVLKQLNWFLRDWRRDEPTTMDPRLFDVVWEVYRAAGAGREPITVMSAYRSPETNAMLRRRSRAVAEYSQHMLGKAMDTSMPGMSMEQIREIGMKAQRGGVGYYPTAGTPFVHLDVGSVRSWPRMSYDQLVRLFPDGKTVHLPTNNQPLARYEEARAEIAAGGSAIAPPSSRSTNFFAWLFGGGSRDGDDEDVAQARVQTASRRGRGNVQMASMMPRLPAAGPNAAGPGATSNYDDTGRNFFAAEAVRNARTSAPAPVQPAVAPVESAPPRAEAPPPAPEPARTAVASLEPTAAAEPDPVEEASAFANHPQPPRRPASLAEIEAPLPPVRPVELASLGTRPSLSPSASAYASFEAGAHRDPIGAMLDRETAAPSRPAERKASARPVSVATVGPVTGLRAARAIPEPPVVPARLDRSNFGAMTGHQPAARMTTQTVNGPTLTGLRAAARAEGALLAPATDRGARFGKHATDLPTSGFAPDRAHQASR